MNEPLKNTNENQVPAMYPAYMQNTYQDDEINLIDLWVTLSAYKTRFLKVFIGLSLLAILYGVLTYKESYELTTTIQIGTYTSEGAELAIESPEALLSKITNSIEPIFTKKWKQKVGYENIVETIISNPKASNIIILNNKATKEDLDLFSAYQLQLAEGVVVDHQNIIVSLQAGLFSRLALAKLKLDELENPLFLEIKLKAIEIALDVEKIKLKKLQDQQFFGIKKNQFKNTIIAAQHTLALSVGQSEVIKKKLLNLDRTKSILKKNIDELQQLILVAHKNKKRSLSKANELNAMSLLLIDNEIQQNQNRLLTLEERYYVGVENERSELEEALNANQSTQIDQQNKIAILEEKFKEMILNNELEIAQQQLSIDKVILGIEKTKFNTMNDIAKQKKTVNELKTKVDNYNKTRVVSKPSLSQKPVGLSQKIWIVIMIFLSAFIAFISVLMAIFSDKIKQRRLELKNEY